MKQLGYLISLAFALATAIIGNNIHGSVFWSIVDFILPPFAWVKWVLCKEVNLTIIKNSFDWFLQ
jgi:hypothetical protein